MIAVDRPGYVERRLSSHATLYIQICDDILEDPMIEDVSVRYVSIHTSDGLPLHTEPYFRNTVHTHTVPTVSHSTPLHAYMHKLYSSAFHSIGVYVCTYTCNFLCIFTCTHVAFRMFIHMYQSGLLDNVSVVEEMLDDCCMQLLIIMDGECNHSMGSPMDGTPSRSVDQ